MIEPPIPNHRFKDEETSRRDFESGGLMADSFILDEARRLFCKERIIPKETIDYYRNNLFRKEYIPPVILTFNVGKWDKDLVERLFKDYKKI